MASLGGFLDNLPSRCATGSRACPAAALFSLPPSGSAPCRPPSALPPSSTRSDSPHARHAARSGTLVAVQPGAAFSAPPPAYIADHDTAPQQVVRNDPTSVLIRTLQNKKAKEDAKRKQSKAAGAGAGGDAASSARRQRRQRGDGLVVCLSIHPYPLQTRASGRWRRVRWGAPPSALRRGLQRRQAATARGLAAPAPAAAHPTPHTAASTGWACWPKLSRTCRRCSRRGACRCVGGSGMSGPPWERGAAGAAAPPMCACAAAPAAAADQRQEGRPDPEDTRPPEQRAAGAAMRRPGPSGPPVLFTLLLLFPSPLLALPHVRSACRAPCRRFPAQ